ncbi:MAG: 4Fe-4S dicluster domain-containing protein [Acidaminobacteraceae bacterium]
MSIRINQDKCRKCKKCTFICPGNLIDMENDKIKILYPHYCWGCTACLKVCPYEAIEFSLTKEQGTNGSKMTLKANEDQVDWKITKANGDVKVIRTFRRDANKY